MTTGTLPIKYRPSTLDEFFGNEGIKSTLKTILKRPMDQMPHSFLLFGPSGTGKTTLARIIRKEMGCSDYDYHELNAADLRKIDDMRAIISEAPLAPLKGKIKIYYWDECFAKGTSIETPQGAMKIEDLSSGDYVFSINGKTKIERVFKNKVPLNRIVKLQFSNGDTLHTTKDHLFLTGAGWKKAASLKSRDLIFKFNPEVVNEEEKIYETPLLPVVRSPFCFQKKKQDTANMLSPLRSKIEGFRSWGIHCRNTILQRVWSKNECKSVRQKEVLLPILCGQMEYCPAGNASKNTQFRNQSKNFASSQSVELHKGRNASKKGFFKTNEREQSLTQTRDNQKNEGNQTGSWDITRLARKAWRKWKAHGPTNSTCFNFEMVCRICDFLRKKGAWVPNKLQSRPSSPQLENSDRDRWERPQVEKAFIARCEENKEVERIGVERIEIYKQGSNNKSFSSIIQDKERSQGFAEFYDLQIAGHPSYFAEGCPVHNCHNLLTYSKEAVLKILEEPPAHVFFLLATTEPEKIPKTIQRRCTKLQTRLLPPLAARAHLNSIIKREKISGIKPEILKLIARSSEGSAGEALNLLDTIKDDPTEEGVEYLITLSRDTQALCREVLAAIQGKSDSGQVKKILTALECDTEQARQHVLRYLSKVLLSTWDPKIYEAMTFFTESFHSTGRAGLIMACFAACNPVRQE